jgi:hypothetical protein
MAYEYWEISVRNGIAKELEIKRDKLKSDIFGDLRLIRNDIIHNRSVSSKERSQKCLILNRFKEGEQIVITSGIFDVICGEIFDYLNELILKHTGEIGYSDKSLSLEGKKMMSQLIKTHGEKL